jgi:nucleoside-triphosphatase THEP1
MPGLLTKSSASASSHRSTQGTIGDAEGDIAALVYASDDSPDVVLCEFAKRLTEASQRVCGLVQLRERVSEGAPRKVVVLDGWQVVDVAPRNDVVGDTRCSLDGDWLDRMGREVRASIARGVDVVIVNRFGPLELAGRGFRDAIIAASETETPLIVAVPAFEFERWTRFSNGMTVRLDCTLEALQAWWQRIADRNSGGLDRDARACELIK